MHRPLAPFVLAAAFAVLIAVPAAAYTVYLKDGSAIQAKDKYVVQKGKAIITLLNGTQSFIDLAQIDVARTEAANRDIHLESARILDDGSHPLPDQTAAAPPAQRSLSDLIASGTAGPRALPPARRESRALPGRGTAVKGKSGFLDLWTWQRTRYGQLEIATDLQQFFRSQGVEAIEVYAGTLPDRAMLELTTNSEAAVFQALTTSANALLRVRGRFPGKVGALELVMQTPNHEKAGQFVLTPGVAADLVAKKVDVSAFFVNNVQF